MNISKDLSFIVKKDLHLSSALDQAKKLDFVKQIQFLDYFKKSDDSFSYTLRFFFDESSSYTNDQITNILDQIIKIFAKHELELNN
jgi:phenylalanyl-tRNA synthetase beta subunit